MADVDAGAYDWDAVLGSLKQSQHLKVRTRCLSLHRFLTQYYPQYVNGVSFFCDPARRLMDRPASVLMYIVVDFIQTFPDEVHICLVLASKLTWKLEGNLHVGKPLEARQGSLLPHSLSALRGLAPHDFLSVHPYPMDPDTTNPHCRQ